MSPRALAPGVAVVVLVVGTGLAGVGCAANAGSEPKDARREILPAGGARAITSAELDELTRAFADRYIGLLYSACDAVKEDNPDAAMRREAQALLVDGASNIYDIASNADAFTRLLDLVVVTRLMSQIWVDDGRARHVFGDRAEPLASALVHGRVEVQTLAGRVLTVEQLGVLDSLLADWRKENPETTHASFVRFSNFAIGRGRSAASEVLAARGFLAQVGEAGQAVDEARLLGERVFYQFKREPTLLRWQAAAAKEDLLATPEVASALADVRRFTDQVEQLPRHVAAERESILAGVDARLTAVNATVNNAKDTVAAAKELVASVETTGQSLADSIDHTRTSLNRMLSTADTLFARFDAWDRWSSTNRKRPFDIREYTEIVEESAKTSDRLNETLKSSGELLASDDWHVRVDELNRALDGRIATMTTAGRQLLDVLFQRLYIALGVIFIFIVCYRAFSIWASHKLAPRAALASADEPVRDARPSHQLMYLGRPSSPASGGRGESAGSANISEGAASTSAFPEEKSHSNRA